MRSLLRRTLGSSLFLLALAGPLPAQVSPEIAAQASARAAEVEAWLGTVSVTGREEPAAELVRSSLPGLPVQRDALGNVFVTLGSGSPKRLIACPLGEPGFAVTRITDDGYLRISPIGQTPLSALWDQSIFGQVVVIGGSRGQVAGAVVIPSIHLMQGASGPPEKPFSSWDAWIDVGAENAAEVADQGVRLLDPVALIRRPVRLAGDRIAGPWARVKGACAALADAARRLQGRQISGQVVFAWTTLDWLNGKGLEHLVGRLGPFDEAVLVDPWFGWKHEEKRYVPALPAPAPGSGVLTGGSPPAWLTGEAVPMVDPADSILGKPAWGSARLGFVGLPALHADSPVETIALDDVAHLSGLIEAGLTGSKVPQVLVPPPLPAPAPIVETGQGHEEVARLLGALIARPAVSTAEGPVREEVLRQLPSWAKPQVDKMGNVIVTVGQGKEHVLFVAHMDEVGLKVGEILPDGKLRLEVQGGLLKPAWEAQAALVQVDRGSVPAIVEPRQGWATATAFNLDAPLVADLGVSSPQEAEALGVHAGSTLTLPKKMFRIGPHRGVGRGFDDRVGCTALLLALRQIDPARLTRRVTFAWVVQEELGLVGSSELARTMPDLTRVHAVDTFVSADSPMDRDKGFAHTPLGHGPVLRAMDNATLTPRELIDRYVELASRNGVTAQVGFTGGMSDGVAFLASGVEMLPFSWPGRHSHSPVEVADFRDIEGLVKLILAAARE
jgi:putative aminopeptidase FrvX